MIFENFPESIREKVIFGRTEQTIDILNIRALNSVKFYADMYGSKLRYAIETEEARFMDKNPGKPIDCDAVVEKAVEAFYK